MRLSAASLAGALLVSPGCFVDTGGGSGSLTTAGSTTSAGATAGTSSQTTPTSGSSADDSTSTSGRPWPTSDGTVGMSDTAGSTEMIAETVGETSTGGVSATGDETATTGVDACPPQVIPLPIEDASLNEWEIMDSQGEGAVAVSESEPRDGDYVRWSVDIPCEDDWYIWVRYYYSGPFDSYFARLDGEPQPRAIFEAGCDDMDGTGFGWGLLNWRDQDAPVCVYVANPWIGEWGAGEHQLELSERESDVVARALVVNDADFVPGPND